MRYELRTRWDDTGEEDGKVIELSKVESTNALLFNTCLRDPGVDIARDATNDTLNFELRKVALRTDCATVYRLLDLNIRTCIRHSVQCEQVS